MRALSIRQPYAEQILRGEKTIEYRSRRTKIIGKRFYIYVPRKWAGVNGHDVSLPLPCRGTGEPPEQGEGALPTGVIVGTAKISRCVRNNGTYEWHLSGVKRLKRPRKVNGRPQPVWFTTF